MSRKIDALIAEHIFGYLMSKSKTQFDYVYEPKKDVWGPCYKYSTDIAAAWEVVEKFNDSFVDIRHWHPEQDSGWHCMIQTDDTCFEHPADTAPMAICLAALKAKGIEVGDE